MMAMRKRRSPSGRPPGRAGARKMYRIPWTAAGPAPPSGQGSPFTLGNCPRWALRSPAGRRDIGRKVIGRSDTGEIVSTIAIR